MEGAEGEATEAEAAPAEMPAEEAAEGDAA